MIPLKLLLLIPEAILFPLILNIEGIHRNIYDLKQHIDRDSPDLIFLQEPMCFQHDLPFIQSVIGIDYSCLLNSDDKYETDLPLQKNRAHGGVLTLFKKYLEPSVFQIEVQSSRILPIGLKIKGYQHSSFGGK